MTAEAEVCHGAVSEVAGVEEKREFKARSFQDLAKPELDGIGNHDQADDPEDSYVLVTGVGDPSADGKDDMAAVDSSPRHESSAPGELLGAELGACNGNPDGANVGRHGNAGAGEATVDGSSRHESSAPGEILGTGLDDRKGNPEGADVGNRTLVSGSPDVLVISTVDGGWNQENTVEEENKCSEELNDKNGKMDVIVDGGGDQDNTVEVENKCSEELNDQHEKIDVANGEFDPTLREGGIGKVGSPDETPSVEDGVLVGVEGSVQDEDEIQDKLAVNKPECEAESEIKKAEDSNGKIERSEEAEVANKLAVSQPECEAEFEINKADDSNGKIERTEEAEVANKLTVGEPECEAGSGIKKAEDSNGKTERSEEAEVANKLAVSKPECEAESEVKKAEDSNGNSERSEEAEVANKLTVSRPECEAESGIKKAEDSNGKTERSEGAEVANKLAVSKPECEAESEIKKAEDSNGNIERSEEAAVANKLSVCEPECEAESGIKKAEDSKGKTERSEEAEVANKLAVSKPECKAESEIKKPEDSNGNIERSEEAEIANKLAGNKPECEAESQIKAEDSAGKIERSEEAEIVEFEDQDGKIGVVPVTEPDSVEENQESEVPNLRLVADSGEEVETKNLLSPSDKQETVEDEAESAFGKEAVQDQTENDVQNELDKQKVVESTADCNVGTACGEVSVGKDEEIFSVSLVQGRIKYPDGAVNSRDGNGTTPQISVSEREAEVYGPTQKESASISQFHTPANEVQFSDAETAEVISSLPVDGSESESFGNELIHLDSLETCGVDISNASPEFSSDIVTNENVSGVAVTKPFNFFVRAPRYSDEKLQEQIRIAEIEVNDKTKLRDSIQAQIQEIRAKNQNNGIDHEYAKCEERSLKKLLKEKRMEIDSFQSVINKAKTATSIEDLNTRIKAIEHMIQHETLNLKEEKQFIHEIKQLKQLREQLSSTKCSQNEIQQALEQREKAEERLKILRKELGNLKDTASKAQTACDEAESKYDVEYKKVKELQAQFRASDDVRQEAYAKFLSLSKELSRKRKNFFKYKNDSATATSYAFTDDRKALYSHCANEVEKFMEFWNGNAEFRSEYVRLNTRSTVRRFGTLDGRSLGPGEKPTILPSYVSERNDKVVSVPAKANSISKTPTIELKPEIKIENVSLDIHSSKKETESKAKTLTTGRPAKSKQGKSLGTVSGTNDEKVEVQEQPVMTKEELELIRKAEELRREEAEAKLKEQRRLEEIVKAKEARERKQRRDEKAQKREELKARKEAEQKEKEREKKSRKKERKMAASTSTSAPMDAQDDASSITCVETSKDEASTKVSDVSTTKPKTSRAMVGKQNKTRIAPPPSLRNRNRRKRQQWMWAIPISLAVLVLIWLGNLGVFSSVNSKLQGSAGF